MRFGFDPSHISRPYLSCFGSCSILYSFGIPHLRLVSIFSGICSGCNRNPVAIYGPPVDHSNYTMPTRLFHPNLHDIRPLGCDKRETMLPTYSHSIAIAATAV